MNFARLTTASLAALLLFANACAAAQPTAPPRSMPADAPAPMAMPAQVPGQVAPATPSDKRASPTSVAPSAAKTGADAARPTVQAMLVYTGSLTMLADAEKTSEALDLVVDAAESMGGHLAGRTDESVTVKVPSARFRETLTKLETVGTVIHRSVTADDVTEEFHDGEVRLQNLKATRARLQEFLARAGNIADTLTVERELERVAQEIDRLEGRLHFLKERAAWSAITVAVKARPKPVPIVNQGPPPPPPPPPPANPRLLDLPVPWLGDLGIGRLFNPR